jgi:hypothetical protein
MSTDVFGILDDTSSDPDLKLEPFFKIIKKNDKELHEWLNVVVEALVEQSQMRTQNQKANLAEYRGVHVRKWEKFSDRDRNQRRFSKIQKFVVNHLHDMTETKVSQLTRLKPHVEILPTNDEWADRASAKVVGSIVKHVWYQNDIDDLSTRMQREARIFGESFIFPLWNPEIGDLSPTYIAARDAGLDVEDKQIQSIKFIGDIEYEPELPWRVLLQRTKKFSDCEYVFRVSMECTEALKKQYPSKKNKIKETEDLQVFSTDSLMEQALENQTLIFTMYHKKTKNVSEGAEIKFTKDVILEKKDSLYSHGKLPLIRLTDLDVPDVLHGVSKYEMIAPIQRMYNNISTLIAKNIYLTAHAKWVMPRGTCKIEQLGNDNTIVQYQGQIAPQLMTVSPNSAEVYRFRDQLVQDMQTIYGSHGISRGEVPKGITAASALQFLNELENERASTDIAKHGKLIKDFAKFTVSITGDFYKPDDGRMIRIVGENNKYLIRHFDTAHLSKSYDIRIDNSTGLPETKSAKIQRVLDTMQRYPKMLSPERWTELLDLANVEKMTTLITEAVRSADSENEDLMAGRPVLMPEEWENHILHWEAHAKIMQSRQFKEESDPQIRAKFKDHVYWTEEAMIDKYRKNPEFEAKAATLLLFPLFEHEGYVAPRSMEQQIAMTQGQANRGAEVTGQIPGSNSQDIIETQNAKDRLK